MGHIFFQNTVSTFVLSGGSAAHFPENQLVQGTKGDVQPQNPFYLKFQFWEWVLFWVLRFFSFFLGFYFV